MKKKLFLGGAVALFVTFSVYAATCYSRVQDSCGKCYINCDGTERVCGKCGGWLSCTESKAIPGTTTSSKYQRQGWFKCKCGHQSKWKW